MKTRAKKLKVLYIDDEPSARRLAEIRLKRHGWAVSLADDGDTGLKMLADEDYDVAIIDYMMPRMDGLAVLDNLQKENTRVPSIVATATGDERVAVEAMKLGAGDYIVKDVDGGFLDLIPTIVNRLVEQRILREEKERADEALRESEARYRQIVETAQEGIVTLDAGGLITFVNRRALAMLGYANEEIVGGAILDFLDHDSKDLARRTLERRGKGVRTVDLPFRHRNGMLVWAIASTTPFQDDQGEYGGSLLMLTDITERKWTEEALRKSEQKYRSIIDTTAEGYWLIHPETWVTIEVNQALCAMLGYEASELVGKTPFGLADAQNRRKLEEQCNMIGSTDHRAFEVVLRAKDGRPVHTRFSASTIRDIAGSPVNAFAFVTDVSEEKAAEDNLRLAAAVYQTTTEAIMVTDADRRIKAVNPAFTTITGYGEDEVLDQTPDILNSGRHDREFLISIWRELKENGSWQGEVWNRRKSGEVFPEWLSIAVIRDKTGKPSQYVSVFSDITKRKEAEEVIRRQANYDPLTELPNRILFMDRLSRAVGQAEREGYEGAVMVLDLNRFKAVNDSLGHTAGDKLLQEAGRRISASVRETDTVARLGGDEFTVILPKIARTTDADIVAKKILSAFSKPFLVEGQEAFAPASIGVTVFPTDGTDADELVRNADWAMHKAKKEGHEAFRYFTLEMTNRSLARMRVEGDLRRGLERGELAIHYQPIMDLRGGGLASAEALARWRHPDRGLLPPVEFIPLAEETGLIIPLGEWVLWEVCGQIAEWEAQGVAPNTVAINLSSRQFTGRHLEELVTRVLDDTGVAPERLELEITESVLLEDSRETIESLRGLMAMGVKFSIDDFGTGYSSLGYLKRFPFDVLKIDQVFVGDVTANPEDATLARTIIAMAHGLGLRAVAEGVETAEQLAFLKAQDCDYAQGFYFSRPVPAEEFTIFLQKERDRLQGSAAS